VTHESGGHLVKEELEGGQQNYQTKTGREPKADEAIGSDVGRRLVC